MREGEKREGKKRGLERGRQTETIGMGKMIKKTRTEARILMYI